MSYNMLTVLSANTQGLGNGIKRFDVINYFKDSRADIICLQDTHLTSSAESNVKSTWGNEAFLHGKSTNSRGVMTLVNH